MTVPTYAKWIQAGVGVALIAFGVHSWLQQHDAQLKAESTQTLQAQVIKDAQSQIDKAKADQAQTNANLAEQLKAIAAQRTIVVTPQQAVAALPAIVPNLPQPVTLQPVAATPTEPAHTDLVIPQADIPAFQNYKLDCDTKGAKLDACALNAASSKVELDATNGQLKAMTTERDAWQKAAKGTFWGKLGHKVFCVAASGAGSYLGSKAGNANGAAIGAVAGTLTCELVSK